MLIVSLPSCSSAGRPCPCARCSSALAHGLRDGSAGCEPPLESAISFCVSFGCFSCSCSRRNFADLKFCLHQKHWNLPATACSGILILGPSCAECCFQVWRTAHPLVLTTILLALAVHLCPLASFHGAARPFLWYTHVIYDGGLDGRLRFPSTCFSHFRLRERRSSPCLGQLSGSSPERVHPRVDLRANQLHDARRRHLHGHQDLAHFRAHVQGAQLHLFLSFSFHLSAPPLSPGTPGTSGSTSHLLAAAAPAPASRIACSAPSFLCQLGLACHCRVHVPSSSSFSSSLSPGTNPGNFILIVSVKSASHT